jgi:hypothetical protein
VDVDILHMYIRVYTRDGECVGDCVREPGRRDQDQTSGGNRQRRCDQLSHGPLGQDDAGVLACARGMHCVGI